MRCHFSKVINFFLPLILFDRSRKDCGWDWTLFPATFLPLKIGWSNRLTKNAYFCHWAKSGGWIEMMRIGAAGKWEKSRIFRERCADEKGFFGLHFCSGTYVEQRTGQTRNYLFCWLLCARLGFIFGLLFSVRTLSAENRKPNPPDFVRKYL